MKSNTKIIAMYLPQYHRTSENDLWWGEGFTEWNNVRRAKPLFQGHIQPRVPLAGDYYDLSDPKTLLGQMETAKEYGLDGFCFYHYWFKNGKQLLEKPVDALLNEGNIPLPFMFCWANEAWTRTWDGNAGAKEILIEQEYGRDKEWERHFQYLLKFFQRDEYIKVDGRPVICIYKPVEITDYKHHIDYWNELARKHGFGDGLYVINVYRGGLVFDRDCYSDAVMDFEPFASMWRMGNAVLSKISTQHTGMNGKDYAVIDYQKFGRFLSERFFFKNINHFMGMFAGWDNSPRIGERTTIIFENNTPEVFGEILGKVYERSIEANNQFLFINAWNEWGEGTFLEPDEKYRYGYLEALRGVKEWQIAR